MDLSLERVYASLEALGNPHRAFGAIHVAGTNGKGSTCEFLLRALVAAGVVVGRFVSPFLATPCDAVSVCGEPVTPGEWAAATALPACAPLTEFERWTVAAFVIFAARGVQVAIVEVGIGHAGDSTNALPPALVAVVAPVALDHTAVQGPTVEGVAAHECSIVKPGTASVVTSAAGDPAALAVIRRCCEVAGAPLEEVAPLVWTDCTRRLARESAVAGGGSGLPPLPVPLLGDHQLENAALAWAALRAAASAARSAPGPPALVAADLPARVTRAAAAAGFAVAHWPGRLERVLLRPPGGGGVAATEFLLDGGHNEHALLALRSALGRERDREGCGTASCEACAGGAAGGLGSVRARRRVVLVYGGTASRDLHANLSALLLGEGQGGGPLLEAAAGDILLAAPFPAPPGMPWICCHDPAAVARVARELCPELQVRECASAAEAVAAAAAEGGAGALRVVCGSLYLVGEVHRGRSSGGVAQGETPVPAPQHTDAAA